MRLTIKLKLAAAVIVLSGLMAELAICDLSSLNSEITKMVEEPINDLQNVSALSDALNSISRGEKNAVMNTNPAEMAELRSR